MADVLIVESDSAIKAQDGSTVKALRYVNGRRSGDLQFWPSGSTPPYGTTEDTAFTWTANAGGYWVRVSSYASPHFWGARVGGSTSTNRAAVQAAFDFCATTEMELRFDFDEGNGKLLVDDELLIKGPFNIIGAGRTRTELRQQGNGKNLIRITATTSDITDVAWRSFAMSCDNDAGHVLCMGEVSSYDIITINTGTKTLTVSGIGAASVILATHCIRVRGGGVNDRTYTVSSVSTSGGNTNIVVLETIASGTVITGNKVEWMKAKRFTRNLIQDVQFEQNNTKNSIIYGLWNDTGGFTFNRFDHVKLLGDSGHSAPLIDVASNGNYIQSDIFSDVWADFPRSTNAPPNDIAGLDYVARVACHAASTFFDQLTFENWLVERADGGVINLIGCAHSTIRNVQMYDNGPLQTGGAQITKHLIKLESNMDPSPQVSRMNLLEMIVRHTGALNSGIDDIWIDSSNDGNVLMACQGQSATLLDIQFNSNPAVMVGDKFQQLYNAANVKILSSIGGAMNWPGVITPSALSANTNNYAPTGFSSALVIVQDITTAINLTGLAGGTDGRVIVLRNERVLPASDAITLVHESGSSTAANRFFLPAGANVAIPPQASVILRYHTNRWYLVARGF